MASERRVAHIGLVSACMILVTALTIVYQGGNGPVVGQHPGGQIAPAGDAVRHLAVHPIKIASLRK